MTRYTLSVNGQRRSIEADSSTPLLWVLRDQLDLKGAKFGCGLAQCGACTVLVDGEAVRACMFPVAGAANHKVTTIEGLSRDGSHPLQRAWMEENVPQCGYCQAGQVMQAADLLARHPEPTDEQIDAAMDGNLCRCGTYQRVRRAIHRAARLMKEG